LSATASKGTHAFHAALEESRKPSPQPDLDFLNEEGLLQSEPGQKLCEDQNTLLDEDGDDEDLIPWETTPPRRSYTPLLKRKSDTSTSSTLGPAMKRHRSSGSAALFAIADQFSDFTDAFRSSSQAQPSSLAPSPIQRQCAMQRAQNIETHLTADEMAALIEAFQTDVNAADAYMVMRDNAARHSFVNRKIIQINSR
jgi:hypothetical protein